MTRVQGDLKIITGTAEAATEVRVRSKVSRPVPGGWLMDMSDRRPVFDGKVDLELLPGACVLVAISGGLPSEAVDLIVPESGTASLEACIRAAESAGDLERDALDELRRDFGAWLDEARASVSAAGDSAKAAKTEAGKAATSATNAGKSATAAAGSASAAKSSADNAGKSATAADGSAKAADKSRSDASSFANSAKTASESATASAQQAADSAGVAKTSADRIGTADQVSKWADAAKASADSAGKSAASATSSASAAKTSADNSSKSASAAKSSADAAGESATAAAGSASAAKTDAGKAATSATAANKSAKAAKADANRAANIASSTSWDGDRLTVNGKTSPPLKGEKGDGAGSLPSFEEVPVEVTRGKFRRKYVALAQGAEVSLTFPNVGIFYALFAGNSEAEVFIRTGGTKLEASLSDLTVASAYMSGWCAETEEVQAWMQKMEGEFAGGEPPQALAPPVKFYVFMGSFVEGGLKFKIPAGITPPLGMVGLEFM
ncbi:hypothetical protein HMPREF3166_01345 [Corynebacterium sp. HMSC08A12]|uniref:hypothetical protein n=1 Tax=Corynebacterium sp. HMSC08A12 TaxID=1581134 RepID=UPI0008A4BED5|nr:hypothetical protein [Corynebacterium sp. HMSC08A12]OFT36503.1 hypothetical protein HMPREF3166_01345 [Corynebacterium sp. HMSC08A12]